MKTKTLVSSLLLLAWASGSLLAAPVGTAFTYQGRLADGGQPANGSYDLFFTLYNAHTGGTAWSLTVTNPSVTVSNGLFTTMVDFGSRAFDNTGRWLEIAVATNGSGDFVTLEPRQPLTPTPQALFALKADAAQTADSASYVTQNAVSTLALQDNAVTSDKIANGTITALDVSPNTFWNITGNSGTTLGTQFLGTTDNQPLEFRVNNAEVARLDDLRATFSAADFQLGHPSRRGTPGRAIVDWGLNGDTLAINFGNDWTNTNLGGNVILDPDNINAGTLYPGLIFGIGSGEGIASRRADGTNKWGLDFFTLYLPRMSIAQNGNVGIGTQTPNAALDVAGDVRVDSALRVGSETGTTDGPAYPDDSKGLVVRRLSSTTLTAGSVVARTDRLALERDGTAAGLRLNYAGSPGHNVVYATGITSAGAQVVFRQCISNPGSYGSFPVFSDSQGVVHYDISFGNCYDNGHMTHVVLDRYDDGSLDDYYLVGTVTSTYNQ